MAVFTAARVLSYSSAMTRTVTKAYGLYHRLAHDAINIAHPATLVIDQGGTLRYIYRGENQTDRAPMEQVLEAVRKWTASG